MKPSRKPASKPPVAANGSIVIWLAGLVLGIGAAMILVYRFVLVSHTGEVSAAQAAARKEAAGLHASAGATDDMRAAQAALLKAGPQTETAAAPAQPSGPQASPQK